MLKKAFTVLAVSAIVTGASAQNARMDALSNTNVLDDITSVLSNPADINDYKDQVQGTVSGDGNVSPLIGIKGLGDLLGVGVTYTSEKYLPEEIYDYFLLNIDEISADDVVSMPHLLLGIDLDALQIGVDLFLERQLYSIKTKNEDTTTIETETKSKFTIPGLQMGLNLSSDAFELDATAGAALIAGSRDADTDADNDLESEYSSTGFAANVGAEATLGMDEFSLIIGVTGNLISFGPYEETADTVTTEFKDSYKILSPAAYVGVGRDFEDLGILAAIQANFGANFINENIDEPDSNNFIESKDRSYYMLLTTGVEKKWDDLERLDAFFLRGGLKYADTITVYKSGGKFDGIVRESRTRHKTLRSGPGGSFGLGILKGPVQFDIALSTDALVNVFKLVNGNYVDTEGVETEGSSGDFAKATLTVDFGGNSGF